MGRAAFLIIALSLVGVVAPAAAMDKAECATAYESAQRARKETHLLEAQRELVKCAQDVCGNVARRDCTRWLGEVEASIPSIVFGAQDGSGRELVDVQVLVDGSTIAEHLDGRAVSLDPGPHEVRALRLDTEEAVESRITAFEGDKNRKLVLSFNQRPVDGVDDSDPANSAVVDVKPVESKSLSPVTYVAGGASLVGFAGFGILGAVSLNRESTLRHSCAPSCSPDQVGRVRTLEHLADGSLILGLIGALVATYAILVDPPWTKP
jgi:hypothetical protein